jgi:hypothetical protein
VTIKVALGAFARSGLESYFGADIPAGVQTAMVHYAHKLKAGRMPLAPPRFLTGQEPRQDGVALDLAVDAEDEAILKGEALSQGTTMSQLAVHAVLVYLAELEFLGVAPRVGARHKP